ncbi:unnamed protein product (macronuclear) [Paramecium tetraurelia]|uniref:Arrestin C-terminal-like domain-containing protein n=1 Tax=Paramecium tetraurelia TaxID=5888 RepID=A0D004_PARTE|nr:uncharacterized protein GSPATT00011945001 [Paramecium tetraurelia]CAK76371.1 unnamed protein product [Paramecium tetraurelia]|eukprot:XP_001443768.1 hypothetical protein (macronuclear) [Paramecium tetraurelia strain d4-2]
MGNKHSTEFGGIFVQTSKAYYFPGEMIQGTISLNITKPGYPGRKLYISLTGKEILHGAFDINENSDDEGVLSTNTTQKILKNEIVLYEFQQPTIPMGQFTTTFTFQLPSNIPGTYNKIHLSSAFERIIYKVKGYVVPTKGYKTMSHIQQIQVREPIYFPEQQIIGDGKVGDNGYCCREKGSAQITAVTDRNVYRIGEAIRILIEVIDEERYQKPEKIIIQLENITQYKYKNNIETRSKIIAEEQISTTTKKLGSYKVLNQQEVVLFAQLKNHNNNDQYNMIQPSTNGEIIKSHYQIVIRASFGISCCNQSECLELPIQILSSTVLQQQSIQPPLGWNPMQLNDENLQLLAAAKQSGTSLHSFSTYQKTLQGRNSYNEQQESQRSIRVGNSVRSIQSLNYQMN